MSSLNNQFMSMPTTFYPIMFEYSIKIMPTMFQQRFPLFWKVTLTTTEQLKAFAAPSWCK
jgi:hypothetical protein